MCYQELEMGKREEESNPACYHLIDIQSEAPYHLNKRIIVTET